MIFHSSRTKLPEPTVIRFCRKKIQREKYVKFLGVLLDENLSWKYHSNELSKKLSRTIGIFYRIRHFVPFEILTLLYYSFSHLFLSYGIAVWGFMYKSYFQKLFVLQKKITKCSIYRTCKLRLTGAVGAVPGVQRFMGSHVKQVPHCILRSFLLEP